MKNCLVSVFFEKEALEQDLVNFCCSEKKVRRIFARINATTNVVLPHQFEKKVGNRNFCRYNFCDSKFSFAAGFPENDESLANS